MEFREPELQPKDNLGTQIIITNYTGATSQIRTEDLCFTKGRNPNDIIANLPEPQRLNPDPHTPPNDSNASLNDHVVKSLVKSLTPKQKAALRRLLTEDDQETI